MTRLVPRLSTRRTAPRTRLPDDVADRLKSMIQRDGYAAGERLPSIAQLAADFRVGPPTVREALKRLEIAGNVSIQHGSGVYVKRQGDDLVISNPVFSAVLSRKLLLDLIDARAAIEVSGAELAATHATKAQLAEMVRLLEHAERHLSNDDELNQTNMAFHRAIAVASGNAVFRQLLEVLTNLFAREQRAILNIQNRREEDHRQHVAIWRALDRRNGPLARRRMRQHLAEVRVDLERWNPATHPIR